MTLKMKSSPRSFLAICSLILIPVSASCVSPRSSNTYNNESKPSAERGSLKCSHQPSAFKKSLIENPAEVYKKFQNGDASLNKQYFAAWCHTYKKINLVLDAAEQKTKLRLDRWKEVELTIPRIQELAIKNPELLMKDEEANRFFELFAPLDKEQKQALANDLSDDSGFLQFRLKDSIGVWEQNVADSKTGEFRKLIDGFTARRSFSMAEIASIYDETLAALTLVSLSKPWQRVVLKGGGVMRTPKFDGPDLETRLGNTPEKMSELITDLAPRVLGLPSFGADPIDSFLKLRSTPIYILGISTKYLGVETTDKVDGNDYYPEGYVQHDISHMHSSLAADLITHVFNAEGEFNSVPYISCEIGKSQNLLNHLIGAKAPANTSAKELQTDLKSLLFFLTHELFIESHQFMDKGTKVFQNFSYWALRGLNDANPNMSVKTLTKAIELVKQGEVKLKLYGADFLEEAGIPEQGERFQKAWKLLEDKLSSAQNNSDFMSKQNMPCQSY